MKNLKKNILIQPNRIRVGVVALFIAACAYSISSAHADSPKENTTSSAPCANAKFVPHELWLDTDGNHINAHGGGILYHEGTYYWFGEYKIPGKIEINRAGFDVTKAPSGGVSCYSSTDLMNWKNEGVVMPVDYEDPASDIAYGCVLERPKVIYNELTDKFVMWFHLELKGQRYSSARTAVAVGDSPTGPFTFIRSLRPHAGIWPSNKDAFEKNPRADRALKRDFENGQMARDMTLYVDDDGKAYHIASSEENMTLHISELSPDFLSFTDRYVRALPGGKNEAPAICKHDGRYWLLASGLTGWDPNPARSAVADTILGPWKPLGNPAVGVNPSNNLGPEKTFGAQSTFIVPVQGKPGAFIAMFDIWRPKNPIDGRYIWLPIQFEENSYKIEWMDEWDLSFFD
ncbi:MULTISPECIES: glycoside hydrolase family 43 protein [unclassified Lentimonas]|uniref:glycoside hydrolase family 43 protein n=1 Tax=unclassified Lentimonas TaxID=2630993 RepID=UPI001327F0A8|nr:MULTISPECIES: glycoside hydrolase family 43 protein [unclassified Lentimonas]CAA6692478.1 Beta-glucanase [Lentimonas sp. CC19]CAA6693445.1 Beta-glucanase [Lentimonas sp. CC10]CAA7070774.1 Beta-glucanase [Lentimonas sp. CC11]